MTADVDGAGGPERKPSGGQPGAPGGGAPEGAATAAAPRRGLTPRQAFGWLAVVLAVALVALVAFLLYALRPSSLGQRGGATVEGIQPLFTIEGPGTGKQPTFKRPMGVAFGPNGHIFVTDTGNNRICEFDGSGGFVREWGGFGVAKPAAGGTMTWKPGLLNFPVGIAVDDNGDVYVADFRNDSIQVFDSGGRFLRRFPDPAKPTGRGGSGQDNRGIGVTAVAVRGGYVYATDTYQVFVFKTDGTLVRQFGKPGRAPGDLDHPNGIAVAEDNTVYVADSNHARVTAFGPDGTVKWNAGRIPASMNDTAQSEFDLPRGLAVADDGSVLVVDVFGFELVRVSKNGKVLQRYGTRGVAPGELNFPNGIAVLGSKVAVADKENNRVQVLQLVKK